MTHPAAAAVAAMLVGSSASACDNACTPGFWKNHVDYWYGSGLFCEGQTCLDNMLKQLMPQLQEKQQGPANGLERAAAAAVLNAWADEYYRYEICND
jgi:hypothetical protein